MKSVSHESLFAIKFDILNPSHENEENYLFNHGVKITIEYLYEKEIGCFIYDSFMKSVRMFTWNTTNHTCFVHDISYDLQNSRNETLCYETSWNPMKFRRHIWLGLGFWFIMIHSVSFKHSYKFHIWNNRLFSYGHRLSPFNGFFINY